MTNFCSCTGVSVSASCFVETAVNIGYSCRLLTEDIDETFTVDGESHDVVLSQLTSAMATMQNRPSPASATDSGMIVADDGAGQYVVKTFSNGSLTKFPLSVSIRDGQQDTSVRFRDGPDVSAESEQYALVISGHSLVSTSLIYSLCIYCPWRRQRWGWVFTFVCLSIFRMTCQKLMQLGSPNLT